MSFLKEGCHEASSGCCQIRFHFDRAFGGDRDYRGLDRIAPPRCSAGTGSRAPHAVQEQHEANRLSAAQLPRHVQPVRQQRVASTLGRSAECDRRL